MLLRVLIVDDSPHDAERILRALRRGGYQPSWKRVDTAGTLTAALSDHGRGWDAVTCDDAMPQLRYVSALQIVRAVTPTLPFILVCSAAEQTDHANGVARDDFRVVSKNRLQDLPT